MYLSVIFLRYVLKKQKYYTVGMDTKLLTPDECRQYPLQRGWFDELIKKVQRNAIEVAVKRCSEEVTNGFEDKDGLESYVVNSSILGCKQKLFEENNLI